LTFPEINTAYDAPTGAVERSELFLQHSGKPHVIEGMQILLLKIRRVGG
jgi:hypothetical protein